MKSSAEQLGFGFESESAGDARGLCSKPHEPASTESESPASTARRLALEEIFKREPFPHPSSREGAKKEDHGNTLMREIVRWVERNNPEPYALMELSRTPEQLCGSTCEMYHYSPQPNAAAFTTWIEKGAAHQDLAACGKYRLSFASAVCDSLRIVFEWREEDGLAYSIDDTGAVVPPDSFRPEDAIVQGGIYDGCKILQHAIKRGPRLYMDGPKWYSEGARKARLAKIPRDMRHLQLGQGINLWIELEPSPEFLEEVALEKRGLKPKSAKYEMGG